MVGVFRYEASRAGVAYDVDWTTETVAGPGDEGTTAEGARTELTLNLTQSNLTSVAFVLSWTDDVGSGDELRLTVVDPAGEVSQTASSTSGEIVLTFANLSQAPPSTRVVASDEEAAEEQLREQYASSAGTGTWSIIVEVVNADDTPTPAGNVPLPADTGNSWTLETRQEAYAPSLSRV